MDQPKLDGGKQLLPLIAKVALIAVLFALLVTACGWLRVGKNSPFNHGVAPDVRASPGVNLWVVANIPAAILFMNVFGKHGAEWQYFLCVFVQWFVGGLAIVGLVATLRRGRMVA